MCVTCHPHEVAVIAGGTFAGTMIHDVQYDHHQHHTYMIECTTILYCYNYVVIGEVKVWHLASDSKWVVISSALEVGAHKEPVTKVS